MIYGVRAKGRKRDRPFDHATGRGRVRKQVGKYADALAKGARVTAMIVETTGAITPRSTCYLAYLAGRARGGHGRDGTRYGGSRMSARSYYVHHAQRISKAAAGADIRGIHDSIRGLRMRQLGASPDAGEHQA